MRSDHRRVLTEDIARDAALKDVRLLEKEDNKYTKEPEFTTALTIVNNDEYTKVFSYTM